MSFVSDHLDDVTILDLLAGRVSGDALSRADAHLDLCLTCRTLVSGAMRAERSVAAHAAGTTLFDSGGDEIDPFIAGETVGRFVVLGRAGRGAMGVVLTAYDPELDRRVALKVVSPTSIDKAARDRLFGEARAMARLSHPNVVTVFDVLDIDNDVVIAMELVQGETLREHVEKHRKSPERVLRAFIEAARGLAAAHSARIVHRDFKPDNVLVGQDHRVFVTDFGLAKPTAEANAEDGHPAIAREQTGLAGTPAYMSPEVLSGRSADAKSDQFSFAVALYEALAGRRPFVGQTIDELRTRIEKGARPSRPRCFGSRGCCD